ncbi:MAG: RNA pseudouridine synthase [Desulfovibrio sp.]|jgi:23S rRNA pseudouridine1911/1915/1917 synthase|nr:RNA pseudouridine synthase [Desulfovibrio sp.]
MVVPPERESARLDAVLLDLLPGSGLRARRRLWRRHLVRVNGRPANPGRKVRPGDEIRLDFPPECARASFAPPVVAAWGDRYLALSKEAGLHTARVAGGEQESLEETLFSHWTAMWAARSPQVPPPPPPRLLTRLDRETSGLVLALWGAGPEEEDFFRSLERAGRVDKTYLGLVHGAMAGSILVRAGLRTRNRRAVEILSSPDPDAARHTRITPLRLLEESFLREKGFLGGDAAEPARVLSLVRVSIQRGARHQIRAHLAHAGFPLAGDGLYGEKRDAARRLFLHHAAVRLPGFSALDPPGWGLGEDEYPL